MKLIYTIDGEHPCTLSELLDANDGLATEEVEAISRCRT